MPAIFGKVEYNAPDGIIHDTAGYMAVIYAGLFATAAYNGLAAVHRPPGNGTCGYFYIRSPAPSGAGIGRTSGGPAGPLPDCGASAPDGGMPTGRNRHGQPVKNLPSITVFTKRG